MREAVLRLHGDVGFDFTAGSVSKELAQAGGAPLAISLHSYGGEALGGVAIFNMLQRYPGRKRVTIEGVAASAASVLAMAGDEIVMPRNAFLMIHNAWTVSAGDHAAMEKTGDVLRQVTHALAGIYASRTKKPEAEILELMAAETWFDGEAAVAAGFATVLADPIEVHASATHLARFHRVPAALSRTISTTTPAQPAQSELHMTITPTAGPAAAVPPRTPAASLADLRALAATRPDVLSDSWILGQMEAGATLDTARDAAISALAQSTPPRGPTALRIGVDHEAPEERHGAMAEALAARVLNREPQGSGARFRNFPLPEMAREMLEAGGTRTRGWSASRLINAALHAEGAGPTITVSDFPSLLSGAANRVLAELYVRAQSPLRQALCRVTSAADFRERATLRTSNFPVLEEVPEGGTVRRGSLTSTGESYALATYAKALGITRQALVNDDLDAFGQALRSAASAAAEAEARKLVGLLTANSGAGAKLSDGVALFAAQRGNLATSGTTFDDAGLGAGRRAIRGQKDVDDGGPLGIAPRFLVVSPDQETNAERQLSQWTLLPVSSSGGAAMSAFSGKLELLVEPRLTGNGWYLFADPAQAPVFECAYLDGNQAPTVQTFESVDVLGVTLRVVHDFGAGITGWRGSWRNPGASS
jgi:ATP-dependent protease ClpP protease subunit